MSLAQSAIEFLNEAKRRDPMAIDALMRFRICTASQWTIIDSPIQCAAPLYPGQAVTLPFGHFGFIGLLNGIIASAGERTLVSVQWNEDGSMGEFAPYEAPTTEVGPQEEGQRR